MRNIRSVEPLTQHQARSAQCLPDEDEECAGAEDDAPLILFLVEINDPEHPDDV
jgi:hypothetical protein